MATTRTTKAKAPARTKSAPKVKKAAVLPADGATIDAALFDMKGKDAGRVTLPAQIFGLPWNADLVHQVVTAMQANARHGNAHTKDRGEVQGGGKKPWRQKGTGRARHGSSRSPIWVGGGVAHGPRNDKNYSQKINRKMRGKALLVTLSRKLRDGEVIFVDSLRMEEPKTGAARGFFDAMAKAGTPIIGKKENAALVALPSSDRPTMKSFSNFGNVETVNVRDLNPVTVLAHKYLIIADPATAIAFFLGKKVVKK